jgi:glycosyltransferase involved in cell wall biosynthesis
VRIIGFVKGDDTVASSRHRYWQIASILKQRLGIEIQTCLADDVEKQSFSQLRKQISEYDFVWLQRPLYKKESFFKLWFALLTTNKKVLFDFDDAIYRHSRIKFILLLLRAEIVVAGNQNLAKAAWPFKQAFIIPTTIPDALIKIQNKKQENPEALKIGWAGDAIAHHANLLLLVEPFKHLLEKGVHFNFLLIGLKKDINLKNAFAFLGDRVEFIDQLPWNKVMERLSGVDVGIMPLVDDVWNQGKCALKAIEYMALGKPAIVSPVGMNKDLMEGGLEGLLARNTDEWVSVIEKLYNESNLRKHYAQLCRERIQFLYTNQSAAIAYFTIIKSFYK